MMTELMTEKKDHAELKATQEQATGVDALVSDVLSEVWRRANPNHCPVVLRTGDGDNAGACWHFLREGVCPDHGRIYARIPQNDS